METSLKVLKYLDLNLAMLKDIRRMGNPKVFALHSGYGFGAWMNVGG